LNPGSGVATTNAALNAAINPNVSGLAYHPATGVRYVLDRSQDTLGTLNPATGLVTTIGPIGIDVAGVNGFDISAKPGNRAYLASTISSAGPEANLFTVNLANGQGTAIDVIGGSGNAIAVRALAVGPEFTATGGANPTIAFSVNGSTLTLSWPANPVGWILQSQTNSLNIGLGTNWVDVSGSSLTNNVTLPVDVTKGSVFYRLVYP